MPPCFLREGAAHRPMLEIFFPGITGYLTRHIPSLANLRGVPVIIVRDNGGGSLRLGELVKLKTAMALGVKVRGSRIIKVVEEVLHDTGLEALNSFQT